MVLVRNFRHKLTRSASAGSKYGNTTNGFAFGGNVGGTPYSTAVTEEWSGSSNTIKVLTD